MYFKLLQVVPISHIPQECSSHYTESDVMYTILPLYHTHGLFHCGGMMIVLGCTLVIRSKFSASNFWSDCINYNCTVITY